MTFLLSELGNLFHQKVGDEMKEYIGDWLNVLMTLLLFNLDIMSFNCVELHNGIW